MEVGLNDSLKTYLRDKWSIPQAMLKVKAYILMFKLSLSKGLASVPKPIRVAKQKRI